MTITRYWSVPLPSLLEELGTSARGLSSEEAARRSATGGSRRLRGTGRARGARLFLHQFENPIAAILVAAAILAFFLGDRADAAVILAIVGVSGILGFWQEGKAAHAVERLLALVQPKATVLRDGLERQVAPEEVVPGDVVLLSPGDNVPGDGRLLTANDLFVDEAALTGESFPVAKAEATVPSDAPLARRTNAVFRGTHVVSGSAVAVIVHTGRDTTFGAISERLRLRPPETEFERGVRRFGYLLLEITLLLVLAIFAFNVAFHRPVLDSFLFALALAVGLTPQLLPGIVSVNLAHGARRMAESKVIVRRLSSIENFGSMEVLCCDKTGTLTEGKARVHSAVSMTGQASERTLLYAYLNSFFEKDRVDEEMTARPHRWDIGFIRRFMLLFGLVSSVADYLTFALLLVVMRAPERLFRTGWFVESVVSATLIVLVVRTRHPLHRSRPGRLLLTAVLAVVLATLTLPYLPGAELLGFQHLPPLFYLTLGAIILAYVLSAEMAKRWFYVGNLDAAGVVPLSAGRLASGALSHRRACSR